jgi:tetratricopeptide (TPR) repeat protein
MAADLQRARELFLHAVGKLPPEQWADYAAACGGDADLRQQVEHFLQVHREAGSFLERPAEGLRGTGPFTPAPADAATIPDEGPGAVLGPYKLVQQIGEGGMGTVWMAQQTEPVKRLVALKVIKAGMDSRQVIGRFEAERQALALMDHPHIARVFDAGTTPEGRPYFVMELVKGVPLTKYCDEHRLALKERLELFVPVCQAIQHAHTKGVIHRDVKPSNVLVALYDGRPVPKVIDFGIAKAAGPQLTEHTLVTGFGVVVGTLEYMSPEQAELNQLDIDTRSDIYSLGVLLYELLTGSTPLERKRLQEAALLEVLRLIREEEPPRPSARLSTTDELPAVAANRGLEPKKLSGLVRGELDWIVMKALEKDRNRRYESANAFAADVQRYLADETVQACPPSPAYRLRKLARRNKGRLAVAAGVFLALAVMAASIGWAVRDRAARAEESARAEVARRAQVEGQVRESWKAAQDLLADNKVAAARQKLVEARAQLGSDRAALADLAADVEAGEAELDRFQQFLDLVERAHQAETAPILEPALAADGSPGRAATPPPTRIASRQAGAAVPFLLQALQRYTILERDDWNTTLRGGLLVPAQVEQIRRTAYEELLWLASDIVWRQQGHRSEGQLALEVAARAALAYLGKAESAHPPTPALYALRARCRQALGEEAAAQADRQRADQTAPTLALDYYLRGQSAYDAKHLAEGVEAFEAALRLEPTHYWSLMWLGQCLTDLGQGPEDFAGAARVYTGCLLKRPDHAPAYSGRGAASFKRGRSDKAFADFSRAIELDPKLAPAWYNRGLVYLHLGQHDNAVADCSQAIELDPRFAKAWNNRGIAYNKPGQHDKSLADFSKAIELDPKLVEGWYNRGVAYSKLGQHAKAVADFSQAIELAPQFVSAWYNRGNAHYRLRQYAKAVADYSQAIELNRKDARYWYNRANAYADLGQPGKAVVDCTQAIELDHNDALAWNTRGTAYMDLGQLDKAIPDLSQAVKLNEKLAPAWYNRGNCHHVLGQTDKAIDDYSRAIDLDGKLVPAWFNRGLAYYLLGQDDKTVADCSKVIELDPKHALAHNTVAWLLVTCPDEKRRDPNRAVELATKAVQLAKTNGGFWGTLGVAHYRAGDWKAAVAALDKSTQLLRGGDAGAWLFLAMAHRKLDHDEESRRAYDQALRWLDKNKEALAKNKLQAEELRRFRSEAEEVLELKKP